MHQCIYVVHDGHNTSDNTSLYTVVMRIAVMQSDSPPWSADSAQSLPVFPTQRSPHALRRISVAEFCRAIRRRAEVL